MALVNLKQSSLTEQQKEAIDLLVGKEGDLTQQEIADRVGVSRQSLFNWRKKPEFRQALVEQAKTITDTGLAYSLTWMEQAMKDPLVKDIGMSVIEPKIPIKNATRKGYLEATSGDGIDLAYPNSSTRRGRVQKECSPTLQTADTVGTVEIINPLKGKTHYGWHFEQAVYAEDGIVRTVKAGGGSGNIPKVIEPYRIRKLTPLECWRLMGFTDQDFYKAQEVNSNSQLYKQAGNSIVVPVLEGIFSQLFINNKQQLAEVV